MSTLNELSHRRETIQARLKELATTLPTAKKPTLPETTTTHWSFVLKELQWLATDYASERQRHQTARRKLKPSILSHFQRQEQRYQQELRKAAAQQRQRAALIGKQVKTWWNKVEQIVTHQQKVSYEQYSHSVWTRQLKQLVQQTEHYTQRLATTTHTETKVVQHQRTRKTHNYARLQQLPYEDLYGESTADEDSSESSLDTLEDDETTLRQAEAEDPPEDLALLREEATMDLTVLLERLKQRRVTLADDSRDTTLEDADESAGDDVVDDVVETETTVSLLNGEEDAEDFEPDSNEVDDETTIDAEERMGRGMTYEEELRVLREESEMSVEQLRALYANMDNDEPMDDVVEEESDDEATADVSELVKGEAGDDVDDFQPDAMEADDETTIDAEERLGRDMSYEDEIALLKRESEMSVEELRSMYAGMEDGEAIDDVVSESEGASVGDLLAVAEEDVEDFVPDGNEVDDETTIEAEERLGRDLSVEDEIAALKRDSEVDIEELRAMYTRMNGGESEKPPSELSALVQTVEENENDGDYQEPEETELDDETTMEAEERLGRDMSYEEELATLKRESEMSIEELRSMYNADASSDDDEDSVDDEIGRKRELSVSTEENIRKRPRCDDVKEDTEDEMMKSIQESALAAQRTLAARPFLLSTWVKLREYQQIGLNWLVSLQSRRLNGILADEMGLGKTLQTISLFSYLASYKGIWGPHLVVVPTSVIVNWETELKRFCPALKVLCYYGSAKRRKELRVGWTKSNCYHVVITPYQLAVQDAFAFKRKRWYYMVLDEAQNIKNFQSQRWQTLINFNTQRRLLLTGTPLQNNLMELWSLLHFLMPYIFRSRKEFSYWFANPMSNVIDGTASRNDEMISRLHGIIRPFVLRRLKKDVETQMPGKFEHIVKCQLSRRQMFIYEEFMARSSTRQALTKGSNFMGMMNVLMQLRKVCNHPDLFEPRSIITPLSLEPISVAFPARALALFDTIDVMTTVSKRLLQPIWCGSDGLPYVESSRRHNQSVAAAQSAFEVTLTVEDNDVSVPSTKGLVDSLSSQFRALIAEIKLKRGVANDERVAFLNSINRDRCGTKAFPYPSDLIDQLTVATSTHAPRGDLLSTPEALLHAVKSERQRAIECDGLIAKFVFCVPKASAGRPVLMGYTDDLFSGSPEIVNTMESLLRPSQRARERLTSFFPDRKLVQFDSGKLQTLAELLRQLKVGGHRVLIFTQMSKMLDILEAFLNLNGHTYLRLDGSTGVDKRQRLMDTFNGSDKYFCFILSTRSGGLGINLTGADSVIFYDSDWNPAMDAQAQDRAHRIGQTRDVHIYRLVTEHSVEENILKKAQQKRNLDILVMDKGKFDSSGLLGHDTSTLPSEATVPDSSDIFNSSGLRSILGVRATDKKGDDNEGATMSSELMEKAMTSLEDADDVVALRGAQKEAAEELQEFDESVEYKKEPDDDTDPNTSTENSKPAGEAAENDKGSDEGFATWQNPKGLDMDAIRASLSATEKYGIGFKEDVDPYYSKYAVMEYNQKLEDSANKENEIDIDEIEEMKTAEEKRAFEEGDLLCTYPDPDDLARQKNLYHRERARLRGAKRRRELSGDAWESRVDALTSHSFWYNSDTGEARWDKPKILMELEAVALASRLRWSALPQRALVRAMDFIEHVPDRMAASRVCKHWHVAANDHSFVRHVYPVEMGAYTRDESKIEANHYRTIEDAVAACTAGDTIELGDGHYWINSDIVVDKPLRLIGDENNPSNVLVEMSGSISWHGRTGWLEGITFRRPQLGGSERTQDAIVRVGDSGMFHAYQCVFDNSGSGTPAIHISASGTKGTWTNVVVLPSRGGSPEKQS